MANKVTLSPTDLDRIVQMLAGDLDVKFIPSNYWSYNATQKIVTYDRATVLALEKDEAIGLVFRNCGYAHHSNAKKSVWTYIEKAIRQTERFLGKDLIAPRSIMAIIKSAEEERVETMTRDEYLAIKDHALPKRQYGYRKESFKNDCDKVSKVTPIGTMHEDTGIPDYWLRVGIALKAVASGGLKKEDLPDDMPWDQNLCDAIKNLTNTTDIDAMLKEFIAIVPQLVSSRVDHEQPNQQQPNQQQPGQQQPNQQQPNQQQPGQQQPGQSQPVDGQPVEGQPVEGQPVDGQPVEGQPVDGQPVDGQPVEGQPVDGQPVEGQPVEGQPVDGQPVEGQSGESGSGSSNDQPSDKSDGKSSPQSGSEDMNAPSGKSPGEDPWDIGKKNKDSQQDQKEGSKSSSQEDDSSNSDDSNENKDSSSQQKSSEKDEQEKSSKKEDGESQKTGQNQSKNNGDSQGNSEGANTGDGESANSPDGKPTSQQGSSAKDDKSNDTPSEQDNKENIGQKTGQKDGAGDDAKSAKRDIQDDVRKKMEEETKKTSTKNDNDEADFLGGAGEEIGQDSEKTLGEAMSAEGFKGGNSNDKNPHHIKRIVPSWHSVLSTTSNITGQIRKAIQHHFLDNEIGAQHTGLRRGKLHMKSVIRNKMSGTTRDDIFSKRIVKDEKTYAVYILVDVSGSMSAHVDNSKAEPSVYGLFQGNERWMLASRFTTALVEMLERYPGIQIGIGVHNHAFMPLKPFKAKLTTTLKDYIVEQIYAHGGTDAQHAYNAIVTEFSKTKADRKILLHLTDGAFYGEVTDAFNRLKKMNVDMSVLTVGIDAKFAREFVPKDNADEINDSTIGPVLNKHFRRMIELHK